MSPLLRSQSPIVSPYSPLSGAQPPFGGFAAPTSNTTFTPNQFFDACLPHYSRGVVRLVAYLIRKTLGWCDSLGNPQEEQVAVSYHDLIEKAGISREMVHGALSDATAGHFVQCVREGKANSAERVGQSALYELRWDPSPEYRKKPEEFRGFFEGEGNRTDIPNQFFDVVVPNEPLSVIKVVGAIIRFSIGFQAKHGRRRQQATLSYQEIQNYTRIRSRADLSKALRVAQERNYIIRISDGVFSHLRTERRAAVYALNWADGWDGQKSVPAPKLPDWSEKRTSDGQFSEPAPQSEIRTNIQTKPENETWKQQVAPRDRAEAQLRAAGFGKAAAKELSGRFDGDRIVRQISWLERRSPTRNRLGLLRKAIEEDWAEPTEVGTPQLSETPGYLFARHFYAAFAGNNADPVNEPSARDTAAAESFLLLLTEAAPEITPTLAGRELGRQARAQRNPFPSLQLALRQLGDQLYVRLKGERERKHRESAEADRAVQREKADAEYHAFLADEERRLQQEDPDAYKDFLADRAAERDKIANDRFWSKSPRWLELFDSDARRLNDLQEYFLLPDFKQWVSAHYPPNSQQP